MDALEKNPTPGGGGGGAAPDWLMSLFACMLQPRLYMVGGWGPQGAALAQVLDSGNHGVQTPRCITETLIPILGLV